VIALRETARPCSSTQEFGLPFLEDQGALQASTPEILVEAEEMAGETAAVIAGAKAEVRRHIQVVELPPRVQLQAQENSSFQLMRREGYELRLRTACADFSYSRKQKQKSRQYERA
jgi:hypothetical protein